MALINLTYQRIETKHRLVLDIGNNNRSKSRTDLGSDVFVNFSTMISEAFMFSLSSSFNDSFSVSGFSDQNPTVPGNSAYVS
uniref:CSON012700 protein n=1 Tax=Culicoides sonorensis TaxID=179676 RepID=A0A336M6S8_CULSO